MGRETRRPSCFGARRAAATTDVTAITAPRTRANARASHTPSARASPPFPTSESEALMQCRGVGTRIPYLYPIVCSFHTGITAALTSAGVSNYSNDGTCTSMRKCFIANPSRVGSCSGTLRMLKGVRQLCWTARHRILGLAAASQLAFPSSGSAARWFHHC